MWYIWDILSVLIIVIMVYVGVKRGFVRTFITTLCYFISVFVAGLFGPKIAAFLYNGYVSETITTTIKDQISAAITQGATTGADVLGALPSWIGGLISSAFPDFASTPVDIISNSIDDQAISSVATNISDSLAGPITQLMGGFIFIILFFIIIIIVRQIAKLFTEVNKIPLVGTINMIFGGVMGLVGALIILILLSILLSALGVLLNGDVELLQQSVINDSYIMGTLQKIIFQQ